MKKETAKLVTFGKGGDSVYLSSCSHISGYGNPEKPHAADTTAPHHTFTIPDGCPVLDNRSAVDTKEGFSWVFKGPVVNVDLADEEIERCPEPSLTMVSAMAGNSYGTLLALQTVHSATKKTPGPLDSVSIKTYLAGWKAHGARIGHYKNNAIVWED